MKYGQVKNPERVIIYKPVKEEEDPNAGGDIQQFFSFILCFGGIILKVKTSILKKLTT